MKNNLINEIGRINFLMKNLLSEQRQIVSYVKSVLTNVSSLDDILKKFFKEGISNVEEREIRDILERSRGTSGKIGENLNNLTTGEISKIFRHMKPNAIAESMMQSGIGFTPRIINGAIDDIIQKSKLDVNNYNTILNDFKNKRDTFFGLFGNNKITNENILNIVDEYFKLFKNKLDDQIKNKEPELFKKINPPKTSVYLETVFKNTITYKRMIFNSFKNKVNLKEEIDEILKELESAILANDDKRISVLTKKWTDYVSSILPKYDSSIKEIANTVYIKELPKAVKNRVSAENFYVQFMNRVNLSGDELKEALKNPFLKIIPLEIKGGKFKINLVRPTKELYKRMGAIIARNSLSKMEDVILLLMNKGLFRYLTRRTLTTLLMSGAIVPIVYGTIKSFYKLFPGVERDDKSFVDEVMSAIKNSLDKINLKDFTNIDNITPYVIDELTKIWSIMNKPSLEYPNLGEALGSVENKIKDGSENIQNNLGNIKDIKDINPELTDAARNLIKKEYPLIPNDVLKRILYTIKDEYKYFHTDNNLYELVDSKSGKLAYIGDDGTTVVELEGDWNEK